MPKIHSKRQMRFMQAIAHGTAKKKPKGLSVAEAKAGLAEMGSAKSLPEKAKKRKK